MVRRLRQQEEINLIQIGRNYGWNIMEGTICYEPNGCDVDSLETPLVELDEKGPQYCAIIGEYAFQGRGIPPLVGHTCMLIFAPGRYMPFGTMAILTRTTSS